MEDFRTSPLQGVSVHVPMLCRAALMVLGRNVVMVGRNVPVALNSSSEETSSA